MTVTRCDKCGVKSVAFIRYSGAHLCEIHFCEFVEKRVKQELRRQVTLTGDEKVAVALSGGKDSTVALHLTAEILGARRDLEVAAVTVDEGIEGYRASSVPIARRNCDLLGIEHTVVSFEDVFGTTMDGIAAQGRELATCSYCGVLRRAAMNKAARDWGATHLVTGLNLDDSAQSIIMNFMRGDVERMARLGPHRRVQPGLVPRLQPLRTIPENETTLYAMVRGYEYHDLECPYASEALRNDYRNILTQLEDKHPGTRHSIIRSFDGLQPTLEKCFAPAALNRCTCGEPTVSRKCKACELVESLSGSPPGRP